MEMQEAFSKAYLGVMQQGRLSKNAYGGCYRRIDGSKCAIGHLMSDQDLAKIESLGMNGYAIQHIAPKLTIDLDMVLLMKLQRAHDRANSLDEFTEKMKLLADEYRLELPAIPQ